MTTVIVLPLYIIIALLALIDAAYLLLSNPRAVRNWVFSLALVQIAVYSGALVLLTTTLSATLANLSLAIMLAGAFVGPAILLVNIALLTPGLLRNPLVFVGGATLVVAPVALGLFDLLGLSSALFGQALLVQPLTDAAVNGQFIPVATYAGPLYGIFGWLSPLLVIVAAVYPAAVTAVRARKTEPVLAAIARNLLLVNALFLLVPPLTRVVVLLLTGDGAMADLLVPLITNAVLGGGLFFGARRELFREITERQFSSLPLRVRFVLVTTAVGLPLIVLLTLGLGAVVRNVVVEENANRLRAVATSHSLTVNDAVAQQIATLNVLADEAVVVNAMRAANNRYADVPAERIRSELGSLDISWRFAEADSPLIRSVVASDAAVSLRTIERIVGLDIAQLALIHREGFVVAATSRTERYYVATQPWWRDAFAGGIPASYVSDAPVDVNGEPAFFFVVPITDVATGEALGVLRASVSPAFFHNLLDNSGLGDTGDVHLLNESDIRFASTATAADTIDTLVVSPLGAAAATGWTSAEFAGVDSLVAWAGVDAPQFSPLVNDLGWRVVVNQDEAEALQPLSLFTTAILIALPLAGVLNLLLALVAARTLLQPIRTLSGAAERVSAGDFDVSMPVTSDDEFGQLAETFNAMLSQIRSLASSLQSQVDQRTAQLDVVNEINQVLLSPGLTLNQVLQRTVALIQETFDFYQISIFLVNPEGERAVIAASVGPAAEQMLARRHSLALDNQSIVGYAASNNRLRIAADTGADRVHFRNPLLPDTRAEMGVPLSVGADVIGVLDVQATEVDAFEQFNVRTFQSIANQIALALSNSRMRVELRDSADRVRRMQTQVLGRAWQEYVHDDDVVHVRLQGQQFAPVPGQMALARPDEHDLRIPIRLRGFEIGQIRVEAGHDRVWSATERLLAETIVEQAALAIENARLIDQAQRLAQREQTIGEIGDKIRRTPDVETILRTTLTELGRALNARQGAVRLTLTDDTDGTSAPDDPQATPAAEPTGD